MSPVKKLVATVLAIGVLLPAAVFAQTTATSSISIFLDQIKALQAQIVALQQQQRALVVEQHTAVASLVNTLREGERSDNVRILQALLAADANIYPEGLISGFFGRLTAQAVKRFQKKHGLEQVGNVGPRTLKKLNELLGMTAIHFEEDDEDDDGDDNRDREKREKRLCAMIPPGHLIAPGWLRKHDGVRPVVPPCQVLPPSHGTTTPPVLDIIAPIISGASVSLVASTSATVSWTTNENATGKVYYATTSPVNLLTALTMSSGLLTIGHSFGLTSLSASTTYFYVLESKDAANNTASSSASFTTN